MVGWVLELSYPTPGSLRTEVDTQLGSGGLYLDAALPEGFPEDGDVVLRLLAPGIVPIDVRARVSDGGEGSFCIELDEAIAAELRARTATVEPAAAETPAIHFAAPAAHAKKEETDEATTMARRVSVLSLGEKLSLAQTGTREWRALLARDRAGPVQVALVRSPRISVEELCAMARGGTLAPDAAEALMQHPTFGHSPTIVLALVRNSRTPIPIATQLVARLLPNDLRQIAKGVGVRGPIAAAARKRLNS